MMRCDENVLQFIKHYIYTLYIIITLYITISVNWKLIIFLYILLNINLNIIFRNFLEATKITISCI